MVSTIYHHIQMNDQQVPMIADTTMKLVELIASQQAYGWSPEELHFQYPHLPMSQIYSALNTIDFSGGGGDRSNQ
jgi:uncharacterized protein (DUF433 family)